MSRRKEFFPEVTDQQWNDWHWQVKNRIETVDELKKYIKLTAEEEEGIRESLKTLRMAITPYYLTLIDPENPHCPIRKQAIPTVEELKRSPADLEDPLHEDSDSPVPGLTHRYPDRVLFLITDMCSMYCRTARAAASPASTTVQPPRNRSTTASTTSPVHRRYATCCSRARRPAGERRKTRIYHQPSACHSPVRSSASARAPRSCCLNASHRNW